MTASPAPTPTADEVAPFRASLLAFLATAQVSAVAVATATVPEHARSALGWTAGVGTVLLCGAAAVAANAVQSARILGERFKAAARAADALRHDREALAKERSRLTGELNGEYARIAEELRTELERLTAEHIREHDRNTAERVQERIRLVRDHTRERVRLAEENERLAAQSCRAAADRASALSACAKSAGRMQALLTSMLADLREMEERYTDERVLGDLLQFDHRAAQAGRLADSIAVLTGSRSGRRWAQADRHGIRPARRDGHDNAANFSPPTAEVYVYVEEVPSGALMSLEDSGLMMGEVQLRRAKHVVSGDVTDLGRLSVTRLGLAVVGRLAPQARADRLLPPLRTRAARVYWYSSRTSCSAGPPAATARAASPVPLSASDASRTPRGSTPGTGWTNTAYATDYYKSHPGHAIDLIQPGRRERRNLALRPGLLPACRPPPI
ncbi:ATP-binding protein [Streptomyces chengmaiensis]|uniref:ATP-binding protein n=1 Tax=Streptomyces chengmaiensis TaxID=3040919 RepID=UPI0037D9E1BF